MMTDISWQASLASSAVTAANEVRCTVHASQTAACAKEAADSAYKRAAEYLDTIIETDESEVVQAKVATLKQQAIHSAIVEYETLSAKHNSSTALAHDVRTWNVHRKREVFSACWDIATSQQKASNHFAQAWEQLRDGFMDHFPLMDISTSQSSSSIKGEYTERTTNVSSRINQEKNDFSLQDIMLADYLDVAIPFGYCTNAAQVTSSSSAEVFENNAGTRDLGGILSCGILSIGNKPNIENSETLQREKVLNENEEPLSLINAIYEVHESKIQDSDEVLDFRSLSFDDVGPQSLFGNNSENEELIYAFHRSTEDVKSHFENSFSVEIDFKDDVSPVDLPSKNDPIDTLGSNSMGNLTRMNSMESLINGLMTWATYDVEETTIPLDITS